MKKKHVAGLLAFFLGVMGVHRYYLGQRLLGAFYTFAFFISMIITIEEGVPAVMFPAVLGFIDAVLFFVMPKEDFDERYNSKRTKRRVYSTTKERKFSHQKAGRLTSAPVSDRSAELQSVKKRAIELFRDYEFEEAVELFLDASELAPNDPSIHFNLACCYSMIEEAALSFRHLQKAVENGFDATKKIHSHTALAYLRTHPDFDNFVENGFKIVRKWSESGRQRSYNFDHFVKPFYSIL